MVQRGGGAGFLLESTQPTGIGSKRRGHDFDGDLASETRVAGMIHFAHSAAAKHTDDFI
jgi:hypothetical protein